MRTTVEIDDDALGAAKELAAREKTTAGKIISALALSQPQYPGRVSVAEIVRRLSAAVAAKEHTFWLDSRFALRFRSLLNRSGFFLLRF